MSEKTPHKGCAIGQKDTQSENRDTHYCYKSQQSPNIAFINFG
jgi:hypothetical protein